MHGEEMAALKESRFAAMKHAASLEALNVSHEFNLEQTDQELKRLKMDIVNNLMMDMGSVDFSAMNLETETKPTVGAPEEEEVEGKVGED